MPPTPTASSPLPDLLTKSPRPFRDSSFVIPHASFVRRPSAASRGGFSLIELLICIAIIALVTAAMLTGGNNLFATNIGDELSQVLRTAVREARYQAALSRKPAYLTFDPGSLSFRITSEGGGELAPPIEANWGDDPKKLKVTFFELLPCQGVDERIVMGKEDTRALPRVVFHPDRSCVPFTVELDQAGKVTLHRYDPFSDTEVKLDAQ